MSGTSTPDKPPIKAQGDPSVHHKGTYLRRNALKVVFLLAALLGLIILTVILTKGAATPTQSTRETTTHHQRTSTPSAATVPLELMPDTTQPDIASKEVDATQPPPPTQPDALPQLTPQDLLTKSLAEEKARAHLQLAQLRQQQYLLALVSDTTLDVSVSQLPNAAPQDAINLRLQQAQREIVAAQDRQRGLSISQGDSVTANYDLNGQAQKQAFLDTLRNDDILSHSREAAISPYLLNVGTIIPATLISGINSDMPGQIIAQVSQNVYDSATGRYLLLPQGAKLYGIYDSKIAYGQDRVLTAWTRINYPDGSKLNIAGMSGMDTQGYSGFSDTVDNHYWKTFGNAMLLGLISGTAQAGISSDSKNGDTTSALADGVTQQFAQTGSSLIQKNLDVQPTINVRGGYAFNIMINKDIVLTPY